MFDFSNPLFRDPKGSVYKICLSDSFLYEVQRLIPTSIYKCVPDVFSLEESSSNSNTSFHRQKGCLRLCFLYRPLHTTVWVGVWVWCVCVQREMLCLLWEPLHKIWNISCKSSRGKSMLLLISSFVLPSNCSCPFLPQAALNSCQASEGLSWLLPPVPTGIRILHICTAAAPPPLLCLLASWRSAMETRRWRSELRLENTSYHGVLFLRASVPGETLCLVSPLTDLKFAKYLHTYMWVFSTSTLILYLCLVGLGDAMSPLRKTTWKESMEIYCNYLSFLPATVRNTNILPAFCVRRTFFSGFMPQ